MPLSCLLISANATTIPYPVYPLGITLLAGALRAEGHRPFFYDVLVHGGVDRIKRILSHSPVDCIALSLRNIDTVDWTHQETYFDFYPKLMKAIRSVTDVPVILGGSAYSIFPERLMDLLQADYGVIGPGERILPEILSQIESGRQPRQRILNGISWVNQWSPAEYNTQIVKYYLSHGGMLNLQTKKGCPFVCAYCSYPYIEGRTIRKRDPQEVAEEMMRLKKDIGARYVFFTDAVFNDPEGHYLEVAEALVKTGNDIPWCAYFRPVGLDKEILRLLKTSGLSAMEVGTDAATDKTLSGLNKTFRFSDVFKFHELTVSQRIPTAHFIIFGGPGETEKTFKQGLGNLEGLKGAVVFGFVGIRILPHTPIYLRAIADGILSADDDLLYPKYYISPDIEQAFLHTHLKAAWEGKPDRIYPCFEMYERISFLHKAGYLGPMWDLLTPWKPQS